MAKFCPNCGKPLAAENVKFCPECGAPIASSVMPSQSSVDTQPEKIYLQENGITIGSKMWRFMDGRDVANPNLSRSKIIPVSSISSADIVSNHYWLLFLLLAVMCFTVGFNLSGGFDGGWGDTEECLWGAFGYTFTLVFLIIAIKLKLKNGCVEVHTHNSRSAAYVHVKSKKEANRYLAAMQQCLIENK
jgi:hypothetical protein